MTIVRAQCLAVAAALLLSAALYATPATARYGALRLLDSGKLVASGKAAYAREDWPAAVKWYRRAAAGGDAAGQWRLGSMYDFGLGVTQDFVEAVKWYRRAADQEDADGQWMLSTMYYFGKGVKRNFLQAYWFARLSAEQKNAGGQFWLGLIYLYGQDGAPLKPVSDAKRQHHTWEPGPPGGR